MKITLPLVFETVHALALALWLGADAALIILVSLGAAAMPRIAVVRELAIIEFAAIVMISIQFLTRHRYKKVRTLYVADGVRHLLTFTALLLAAYIMNSVKEKSIGVLESTTAAYATTVAQIVLLTAISSITIWLLAASTRLAATSAAAGPAPAQVITSQPATSNRPIRKRSPKR
jgi:hypothetical protein